jgi:prevent-host-death family protein
MFKTEGIDAVASVTELRSRTTEIVEHARKSRSGILIQRNNQPLAVLVNYAWYRKLLAKAEGLEIEGGPEASGRVV